MLRLASCNGQKAGRDVSRLPACTPACLHAADDLMEVAEPVPRIPARRMYRCGLDKEAIREWMPCRWKVRFIGLHICSAAFGNDSGSFESLCVRVMIRQGTSRRSHVFRNAFSLALEPRYPENDFKICCNFSRNSADKQSNTHESKNLPPSLCHTIVVN